MAKEKKITIIGAGNGGMAAAAHLTLEGHQITLYEVPSFKENIKPIIEKGGIQLDALESSGIQPGFAMLHQMTTNIEEALDSAEIIFVIIPAFGHDTIASLCAPYLKDGQAIILAPGNLGGSIRFFNKLREKNCKAKVHIAEFESMMYACRKKNPYSVWIRGFKKGLGFSAFPSKYNDSVYEKVKEIYPSIIKKKNVIETGMSNGNPIMHVPIMLANLSNINNGEDKLFYHEVLTESIANIISKADQERLSINKIPGIDLQSITDNFIRWYSHQGARGKTLVEIMESNPIYAASKLPTEINHRYFLEDVPFGLIPMYNLLEKLGFLCPTIKALIDLSCIVTNKNLYEKAPDILKLFPESLDGNNLIEYITYGYTNAAVN